MALTKYERGTTFKSTTTYTSGSTYIDPSGNMAFLNVYAPDGDLIIGPVSGSRDSTGIYHYFVSTQSNSDLGIYILEWKAQFNYGSPWNFSWKYDRCPVQIAHVKQ